MNSSGGRQYWLLIGALLSCLVIGSAHAQQQSQPYYGTSSSTGGCGITSTPCQPVDSAHGLPVNVVAGGASVNGFTPGLTFATLTATGSSASVALPSGSVIAFQNTGTTTVSCTLGVGSASATTNEIQIAASSTIFITVGSNTFGACIDQTGSASNLVILAGGSGLGTGFGGGGGSGGSVVTNAGTFAVQNTTPDVAGENHTGEVGGNASSITNDMTTTAATTTTGQSIGSLQTLASAVRVSGAIGASGTSGYVQTITVTFTDAVGSGPLDVYYFNANPTGSTCTNDSAFILANADRDKVIGIAHVTDFTSSNTAVVAQANNLSMLYTVASATSIFACVVARASFVIASTANASLVTRVVRN